MYQDLPHSLVLANVSISPSVVARFTVERMSVWQRKRRWGRHGSTRGGAFDWLSCQWRSGQPVVTGVITALCLAVWIVEMVLYRGDFRVAFDAFVINGAFTPLLFHVKPWTALTMMFFHAPNLWHLLFNMVTLWLVGPVVERMVGHCQYLCLYLICGLGGDLGLMVWASLPMASGEVVSAYGASGAIIGLFGALTVMYKRSGIQIRSLVILVVILLAEPLLYDNIAWQVHVGGLAVGLLMAVLLAGHVPVLARLTWRKRMVLVDAVVAASIVVALVALGCRLALPLATSGVSA